MWDITIIMQPLFFKIRAYRPLFLVPHGKGMKLTIVIVSFCYESLLLLHFIVIKENGFHNFPWIMLWIPHFGSCVFHSMASSIFIWKIDFYLIKKIDLESPLIFVLFFKRINKIRKKNPKCDSLFWKRWSVKNRIGFGVRLLIRKVR